MSPLVVYVLTAAAAVVVVLTRLRLRRDASVSGRSHIARGPVGVHTIAGALALLVWLVFLVGGDAFAEAVASLLGIVALVLWWVTAIAGILLLMRWLPTRGRHASDTDADAWSRGPGLSLLAHVGLVGAVLAFTYAYLVSAV